jgi:hypothetical protein
MRHVTLCAVACTLVLAGCASVQDLDLDDLAGSTGTLDEATVAAGLREALTVGTERTVRQLSQEGGYLDDRDLHIPLPEEVAGVGDALRGLGLGHYPDEIETAMNRAAEQAAREATAVFGDAIAKLTIPRALQILQGPDTAATDYFRERTGPALSLRYRPIIEENLRQVGGYDTYRDMIEKVQKAPFITVPELDIVEYVNARALDGLFRVLADEEKRIREDPLARTTALLQRVFATPAAR